MEEEKHSHIAVAVVIWSSGTPPPPGTHVIRVPFSFVLPIDLPPSFFFKKGSTRGLTSYTVKLIMKRRGLLRLNKEIEVPFSVTSPSSPFDVDNKNALLSGWSGPMTLFRDQKQVRFGPFGQHSYVQVQVVHF